MQRVDFGSHTRAVYVFRSDRGAREAAWQTERADADARALALMLGRSAFCPSARARVANHCSL